MRPTLGEAFVRLIESQSIPKKVAEAVQPIAQRAIPDGSVQRDLLSGTWLGHPLHPVLTDVVVGAWLSAGALDLLPGERTRDAADALIGLGVLAAAPTAAAGLSDFSDLHGRDRNLAAAHATGNVAAVLLYTASLVARRRGNRGRGWMLSMLGAGVMSATAYLGGHLSFRRGIGVDQTAFEHGPRKWTAVLDADDLADGSPTAVSADGNKVLLVRTGGTIHALSDTCTHRGCSLAQGSLVDDEIECGCHGSRFRLVDGELVRGPATAPAPRYEVRERDGKVEVRAPRA